MLNVHGLSIAFQGTYLFQDVSFKIGAGNRIGLIGKNGAGKSTLLKLLAKEMAPDEGQMASDKTLKIGFLKQDIDFEYGKTVLEEAYKAFEKLKSIESRLSAINQSLAEREDYESEAYEQLMIDLNELQHQYEILGGYNYQGETEKILLGLGFKREDFHKLTDTFSGGWRMRIELAKLLLQQNDLLLLDEPTNHLDIESILWLEGFLNNFAGAVVLVSHDTMFLDHVTNRTIEISLGAIYDYAKPYTQFLELRKEMKIQQLAALKNQEKQIQQTEKLIEKFRAKASKASMAQSLIKKLDRMDRIEVDEEDHSVMRVNFPVKTQPGKVIMEVDKVSKNYGDLKVLSEVSMLISRGSKMAFVGQNGQGKTTLAKIMVGELEYQGRVKKGHNVQIGYFAQNQADYLDGSKTVLDTMIDAANESNRTKVRDILGAFLFRGEAVDKYVKVLSGGERNRLALAKLLLQPLNVLVMDEPTNHLDIQSKNVLKEALKIFEGTLILVSHDREFLQGLTNVVYEFKDQKIKEYLGDIDFYLDQRRLDNLREAEKQTVVKVESQKTSAQKLDYKSQKQLKGLNNKLSKIEAKIQEMEKSIKNDDLLLETDYDRTASDPEFFNAYQEKKSKLESYMQEWETLQMQIDELSF